MHPIMSEFFGFFLNPKPKVDMKRKIFSMLLASFLMTAYSFCDSEQVSAVTATGTVNVNVSVPPVIIVHYFTAHTITFPETAINQGEAASAGWSATFAAASTLTGGSDIETTHTNAFLDSSSNVVSVTLPKVWAVRGWSTTGNSTVSVTGTPSTITGPAGSTITMGSAEVGYGSSYAVSLNNIPLNGLGWNTATSGNLRFTLDFTNTTRAGSHTGGVLTLTAASV